MMKKMILFVAGTMLSLGMMASPVDKGVARQRALEFLTHRPASQLPGGHKSAQAVPELSLSVSTDAYYVFNVGDHDGFVIVGGSDAAPDILGYADRGAVDAQNMPDNMKAWLQGYADEIRCLEADSEAAAAARAVKSRRKAVATKASISPLLTTTWNQSNPYNLKCPVFLTGNRSVTGCAATALAQVLYYHHQTYGFPTGTTKAISSYECDRNWTGGRVQVSETPQTNFSWSAMKPSYTGSETSSDPSAVAVAELMLCCGASINMDYADSGNGGSSASFSDVPAALNNYFGYSGQPKYIMRKNYTAVAWEELIYQEIAANRPVLYSGMSAGGGHGFVCDGYDADGYFHINWGWGGMSDGYFLLTTLNPNESGAGGSSSYDGFSMSQNAVIGIQNTTGGSEEQQVLMSVRKMDFTGTSPQDKTSSVSVPFCFSVFNTTGAAHTFDIGSALFDEDDNVLVSGSIISNREIAHNSGFANISLSPNFNFQSLDAGKTYTLNMVCRLSGTDTWYKCSGSDRYYIKVTATDDAVNIAAAVQASLAASDIMLTTDGVANTIQKVQAVIANSGNLTFNDNVYMFVEGENIDTRTGKEKPVAGLGIEVNGGKSVTASFPFKPASTGTKNVTLTTDEAGDNVIGTGSITVVGTGTDAPELTFTISMNVQGNKIIGNKLKVRMTAVNNTGSDYTGKASPLLWTWDGDGGHGSYTLRPLTVPAHASTDVYYEYDVAIGGKYSVTTIYMHGGATAECRDDLYTYYYPNSAVATITADGTESLQLANTSIIVPSDAVVVDLRNQNTVTNVTANGNPNCLYLLDDGAATPGGTNGNVVKGNLANSITLTDGYDFYTPISFTAQSISYQRTFTQGATADGKGWTTIVLPFDVTSVKQGSKHIDWFHSKSESGKDFWLYSFVSDGDGQVNFSHADQFKANTPYIINIPGNAWGEGSNLVGKPITFIGSNVAVKGGGKATLSGVEYLFKGTEASQTLADGYVINTDGTRFVKQSTVTTEPFRAYFVESQRKTSASSLAIGFLSSEEPTAIESVEEEQSVMTDDAVYNLQGVKVGTLDRVNALPKGIYIVNGKKFRK